MRKKSKLEEIAPHVGEPVGGFVEEYVVAPVYDEDGVQASSGIGRDGLEYPDPVPMQAPLGYEPPPSLGDLIEMLVKRREEPYFTEITETEEEANDFDVGDDLDVLTPYEKVFMPKPAPAVAGTAVVPPGAQGAAEGGPQPTGAPPKPPESVPKVT